jgi:hypothetical protein
MDVPDAEMVKRLEKRDGPLGSYWRPHSSEGVCRYSEMYDGEPCPWCEAETRRRQREAAAGA